MIMVVIEIVFWNYLKHRFLALLSFNLDQQTGFIYCPIKLWSKIGIMDTGYATFVFYISSR